MAEEQKLSATMAQATAKFTSGYNCAQSVLWAFRDEVGLEEDVALKLATGLGAGMGRKQEVCGAVTGGILVLGLRHGRGRADDRAFSGGDFFQDLLFDLF